MWQDDLDLLLAASAGDLDDDHRRGEGSGGGGGGGALAVDSTRACALCQKPLTDAASVEAGVGPICRSRSNEALARTFQVRWGEALSMMRAAQERGLLRCPEVPTVQPTLDKIGAAVLTDPDAPQRRDWREVIQRAAWVLSHTRISGRLRCLLRDLAELLGYPATAALWRGEVVMGEAEARWEGGALWLRGPRPPAEVRDKLHDARWRYLSKDKAWRLTVRALADVDAAAQLLATHYLRCDMDAALAAARQAVSASPAASSAAARPPAPARATWTRQEGRLWLRAPYNPPFIEALKATIPARRRVWVAASGAWVIDAEYQDALSALVAAHFPVAV